MPLINNFTRFWVLKSIRALTFFFRPGGSEDSVMITRGTGWVRHRLIVESSGTYSFRFSGSLTDGNVEVSILNAKKEPLAKLDPDHRDEDIFLEAGNKYYLRWDFRKVSGQFELHW